MVSEFLESALAYAARGWRVFPLHSVIDGSCSCSKNAACSRPGKHPRTSNGVRDATTDESVIRQWWTKWPAANIGVATGLASGLFMLGPDGQAGIDALAALERKYGALPQTITSRSGSGGRHLIFKWPAEGNVTTRANHHGKPIDVRGGGGFFVAPPSVNAKGDYHWLSAADCDAADAPQWLLDWCRADDPFKMTSVNGPTVEERAISYLETVPPAISGQGGHNQTMSAARAVVWGFDLGAERGYRILADYYNPSCKPPWNEGDLRHKCRDADTVDFGKPRGYLLNDTAPNEQENTASSTLCLADIHRAEPVWLWPGYIPRGTLSLLDGDPGLGKSFLTLDIAARVSRGSSMPFADADASAANVLILNAEDDPARTIRPRLEAMGADLERIHMPCVNDECPLTFPANLGLFERAIAETGATLVIIDPLMAFLGREVDAHRDSDIRRVLARIKNIAEKTQAAVLVVRHLNKMVSVGEAVYRGGGSIGIIGAARSALMVAKHPATPCLRVLARVKGNLCDEPSALTYTIESTLHGPTLAWMGEADVTANDLLAKKAPKRSAEALAEAENFLRSELTNGPVPAATLLERAGERGISEKTLRRAKSIVGIEAHHFADMGAGWFWRLPDAAA